MILFPSSLPTSRTRNYTLGVLLYLALAILSGLGLLGKIHLVQQVAPVPFPVLLVVFLLWICLPLAFLPALRLRRILAPLVVLGVIVASLVVYPRMQQIQKNGRGSDQPDCVIVAAKGVEAGQWPYDRARMWSHNPMSCGPGWVLLQTPVIGLLGYRWNLLALWVGSLLLLRLRLGWDQIAGAATLLGLAVVTWVAASDGTDFITFGVVFSALFLVLCSSRRVHPLLLFLLILVVQFRFPTLILPVLFLPRRHLARAVMASVIAYCFQLFFLVWRSTSFIADGPLHLFYKLTHTALFASSRWPAVFEISVVFACMLGIAVLLRRRFTGPWLALVYLLILTAGPSALDLLAKYRVHGALLPALGLWEGANWLSGCLPLAALLLLHVSGEIPSLNDDRENVEQIHAHTVPLADPLMGAHAPIA